MSNASKQMSAKYRLPKPPYPPSWVDRLLDWIDALPGPAWPYYLAGVFLLGLIAMPVGWISGYVPAGSFSALAFPYAVYQVYFVALMHYLDREARSALHRFRPALHVTDEEYLRIEYELTTVPAVGAWIATGLALLLSIADNLISPLPAPYGRPTLAGATISAVFTSLSFATFFILAYHTIRQLRMVSRIHAAAGTINLFQPRPAYAFSRLTARAGTGFVFFAYYSLFLTPPSSPGPVAYLLVAALLAIATAAFILPLLGMHQKLVNEKARLESEVTLGIEAAHLELLKHVHTRKYTGLDDLNKTLPSLLSLREVVAKLPTWPWRTETLGGFITALALPIIIWAVTRFLDRFITF